MKLEDKDILPCGMCGEPGKHIESFNNLSYVICNSNDKKHLVEIGPYKTKSLAIKMWNGNRKPVL